MGIINSLYKTLRIMNDINAVKKGKIARRTGRRLAGKSTGKLFRRLFG